MKRKPKATIHVVFHSPKFSSAESKYLTNIRNIVKDNINIITYPLPSKGKSEAPQKTIQRSLRVKTENKSEKVYCIFDIDNFNNKNQLTQEIIEAEKKGIKIIYSNKCFELWLLLHFENCQSVAGGTKDYNKKLKNHITDYKKGEDIFNKLQDRSKEAIKNSKLLLKNKETIKVKIQTNPSSNIFELIEDLKVNY